MSEKKLKIGDRVRINWEQVIINGEITREMSLLYRFAVVNNALQNPHKIKEIQNINSNLTLYLLDNMEHRVWFYENELIKEGM